MPSRVGLKIPELVSKPWIRFEAKARADEKAPHTRWYVRILRKPATPGSGFRRGSETSSKLVTGHEGGVDFWAAEPNGA